MTLALILCAVLALVALALVSGRRLVALVLTAGAVLALAGILAAPAQARDTTWSCPTCITVHR